MTDTPNISFVVPVYNEDEKISAVLDELIRAVQPLSHEVIVVDDASDDLTRGILQKYQDHIRIIRHPINRGYGASLKTGIRAAQGEYVCTFDGDGQFDPAYIMQLYERVTQHGYDCIAGERTEKNHQESAPRLPLKWALKLLVFMLFGRRIKDFNCGYRIFRTSVIKKYLHICSNRFSFSTTSLLTLLSRGYAVGFLPMAMRRRLGNQSAVVSMRTVFDVLQLLLRTAMLFHPLRIFLPIAFASVAFGIVWGMRYIVLGRGLSVLSLLFILFGILTFFSGLLADQIAEMRKERFE